MFFVIVYISLCTNTSLLMSEEKYEFLFKQAIRNIHTTTSSELTKYATLIAISVDLEKVPMEEQEAFYKVYNKYKKIVAEETQKRKWWEDYREVCQKLSGIEHSRLITPEQQEFMEYYTEIYTQLQ